MNSCDSTPDYSQLNKTPPPEPSPSHEQSPISTAHPLEGLNLGEHLTAEILGLRVTERTEQVKALKKMSRCELD